MMATNDHDARSGSGGRRGSIALLVLTLVSACGNHSTGASPADGPSVSIPDVAIDAPVDTATDARPDAPVDAALDAQVDAALDAPPPPAALAPRLIAPLSLTIVTQQRPTLRWALSEGATNPVVDLCKDRSCTTPLPIMTLIGGDGLSAAPQSALPPGWVYWRVRATSGGQAMTSAIWQFWVGKSSARNPVDTSNGALLDVNGDGFSDFLVAAPLSFSEAGVVYLYLGSATASAAGWNGTAPAARISLVGLDGGFARSGASVASAGDVNGDGFADFLIAALGASPDGAVHLYLGSATLNPDDWRGSTASNRIDLTSPAAGFGTLGASVAGAGDVNGDGYADIVIGTGAVAYVFLGSATPTASDWRAPSSPRRIDVANPREQGNAYGDEVAGAGDVNGDGYADFLVAAARTNISTGEVYLYLGTPAPRVTAWSGVFPPLRIALTTPDGFGAMFGSSIASAGDVNGDGYADFLVGAEAAAAGTLNSDTGSAHLYLGSATPSAADWTGTAPSKRVDLISPDGAMGTFGASLTGAGDVNGDGWDDFLVSAPRASSNRGAAHLYLGGASVNPTSWNGTPHGARVDLTDPDGPSARFGGSGASIGDVNGDGFPDFVVGTLSDLFLESASGGAAHVYLGLAAPGSASWNGTAPARRIDLANPVGTSFGNAVASDGASFAPRAASARTDLVTGAARADSPHCGNARRVAARLRAKKGSPRVGSAAGPRTSMHEDLRKRWLWGCGGSPSSALYAYSSCFLARSGRAGRPIGRAVRARRRRTWGENPPTTSPRCGSPGALARCREAICHSDPVSAARAVREIVR